MKLVNKINGLNNVDEIANTKELTLRGFSNFIHSYENDSKIFIKHAKESFLKIQNDKQNVGGHKKTIEGLERGIRVMTRNLHKLTVVVNAAKELNL